MTIRKLSDLAIPIAVTGCLVAISGTVMNSTIAARAGGRPMQHWLRAFTLYTFDNDDASPIWLYNGSYDVRLGDRDLGNILLPYFRDKANFKTSGSPFSIASRKVNPNFPDPRTMSGSDRTNQEILNLGALSDFGYNYQSFAGAFYVADGLRYNPAYLNQVQNPGATILFANGDFNRDAAGHVTDGGQIAIEPPCSIYADGASAIRPAPSGTSGRLYFGGWQPSNPLAWNVYGGVWSYYPNGRVEVGFADGRDMMLTPAQMAKGCDVRDSWAGRITDERAYLWDLGRGKSR